ncbi:GNAT family N-acetyltransferase [Streptomyces sp. NPDC003247]|uniref:GNAT family N-acetyltransferase n=1 Tax=Streptomyces sp. NPDC003247 TaxID=3364677 RepID=UPI0036C23F33
MTGIEYRTLYDRAELSEACRVFWRTMVGLPPLGDIDPVPGLEPGRFVGAFADGRIVGGSDSYTSWLTVPGGKRVSAAAVTHVGVLPTHTRRGIMRTLITDQLADFARRGEAVATLCPSEAVLYGRFGFGPATTHATARVHRSVARLRDEVQADDRIRLVDQYDARDVLSRIYDTAGWTGSIKRPDGWWLLCHLVQQAQPIKPYRAVYGPPGAEEGFVDYRPTHPAEWLHGHERTVVVDDFVAHTPAAHAGLLRHLLSLDLVDVLEFVSLPPDDLLPTLFTDLRAVRDRQLHDELWIRLVDVPAALSSRVYRPGHTVVIDVCDPLLPANSGRYEVSGAGAARTQRPAGIAADVGALARVYLGGARWRHLVRAGLAVELVPGSVEAADELFSTTDAPYCGTPF